MKHKNNIIAGLPEAYRAIKEMNPETLPVRCYGAINIIKVYAAGHSTQGDLSLLCIEGLYEKGMLRCALDFLICSYLCLCH
jgi:hypothetical protein